MGVFFLWQYNQTQDIRDDELMHRYHKYISKKWVNGRWRYYYKPDTKRSIGDRVQGLADGYLYGNRYGRSQNKRLEKSNKDIRSLSSDAERMHKVGIHTREEQLRAFANQEKDYQNKIIKGKEYAIGNFAGRKVYEIETKIEDGKRAVSKFIKTTNSAFNAAKKEYESAYKKK